MANDEQMRVLLACGGTGGHLFPGIAVAQALKGRGHEVVILVSNKKIDAVAMEEYPEMEFVSMPAIGMPRVTSPKMLSFLWKFWKSRRACRALLRERSIDVVLGMGGFTSMAPLMEGKKAGLLTFIHESNAFPGKVNRMAARFARKVFLGMKAAERFFGGSEAEVEVVGTPVRDRLREEVDREAAARALGLEAQKPTMLVMGGSQGAGALNELVVRALPEIGKLGVQVVHLTGPQDHERMLELLGQVEEAHGEQSHYVGKPFYHAMQEVYALSDFAVARSGASSMTELAFFGLPSLLVPFPFAADDHQTHNAREFSEVGAAELVQQKDLDEVGLLDFVGKMVDSESGKLQEMRAALEKVAKREVDVEMVKIMEAMWQSRERRRR